jgi:hypothetical protein
LSSRVAAKLILAILFLALLPEQAPVHPIPNNLTMFSCIWGCGGWLDANSHYSTCTVLMIQAFQTPILKIDMIPFKALHA